MNRPTVFRQAALNRLSSPDEIDRVLRVTSPRGWIALVALALLVSTSVVWGVTAAVPLTVAARGILLKSGGVLEIVSDASGRVMDVAVQLGDLVREGQVVARLAQPDLADRVQQARLALAARREERDEAMAGGARDAELELAAIARQHAHDEESIARDPDGEGARLDREDLTLLTIRRRQVRSRYERDVQRATVRVHEAERTVAQLERALTAAVEIRSTYTGRVIEIAAEQGAVINRGVALVALDPAGRTVTGLEAILFVPARDGKRVKPGLPVQIAPAAIRPEEYGYLLGKVTQVSEFPTTPRAMLRVLKNGDLVTTMSSAGPLHEVHVDLMPDQSTPSLYRWSSSAGPPLRLQSGTLCDAQIAFDTRRPIELVLPFLRVASAP
jgi:HlyD family secretion protein